MLRMGIGLPGSDEQQFLSSRPFLFNPKVLADSLKAWVNRLTESPKWWSADSSKRVIDSISLHAEHLEVILGGAVLPAMPACFSQSVITVSLLAMLHLDSEESCEGIGLAL